MLYLKSQVVGKEWDCDHIIALCNGGENRESNLAPVLKDAHKVKTAADLRIKKKIEKTRKKHIGAMPASSRPMPCGRKSKLKRKLNGQVVLREEALR